MKLEDLKKAVLKTADMNERQLDKYTDSVAVADIDNKSKGFIMDAITIRRKQIANLI